MVACAGPAPNLPTAGRATQLRTIERREKVALLSEAGWSQMAIAKQLGCDPLTVRTDLHAMLDEIAGTHALTIERLRAQILARLDASRLNCSAIAFDPQCTLTERLAAERQLLAIESKRAEITGATVRGTMGQIGDFLDDLVKRREGGLADGADNSLALDVAADSADA